jgi:anti-anti-sigma factor
MRGNVWRRVVADLDHQTRPEGHRVVAAAGELDRTDLGHLRRALQDAFAEATAGVILDMSQTSYIDSSILAALIAESIEADERGSMLAIATGRAGIMRSLEMKGLTRVMHIAESVDEAIALIHSR